MKRAILLAALALATAFAQGEAAAPPANPNAQAKELATRLGREQSVEGLETIVAARNVDLFEAYERGWRNATAGQPSRPLPPAIEALIIRHYGDPVMGPALLTLCTSNWTPYQTRELFDLMFAEWRSGNVRRSTYPIRDAVLRTSLTGIEAPLLEWLKARDPPEMEDLKPIVGFLGRRRYAPAIPVIDKYQRDPDRWLARTASVALVDIATPEAIDAVLARLAAMRTEAVGATAIEDRNFLMGHVAQLPASVPLPYAKFRAALPEDVRGYSLTWLSVRKDLAAVPDALAILGEKYPAGLEALVATDSPEVWSKARAEVERLKGQGRLNDGQYQYASKLLDEKIADPGKHFAERRRREVALQFEGRRAPLARAKAEAVKLRASDPERYVAAMRDYIAAVERDARDYARELGEPVRLNDVASESLALAHFVRFRLKRPREALVLYSAADAGGGGLGAFGVADTLQFDLDDAKAALAQYRKLLALHRTPAADEARRRGNTEPRQEEAMQRWVERWLAAQVEFLATGKTFSATLGPEDIAGAALALYFGGGGAQDDTIDLAPLYRMMEGGASVGRAPPAIDRKEVARVLASLPRSGFTLMRTAYFVAFMPDARSILAYLARQDPAGYASAGLFGVVELAERNAEGERYAMLVPGFAGPDGASAIREAKARFLRERRIVVGPMPARR